jgi:hypothetical protein
MQILRLHCEHSFPQPNKQLDNIESKEISVFTRAPDESRHYTRTAFTDILRYRLVGVARHLGIDIDVKAFSGFSFRKGSAPRRRHAVEATADGGRARRTAGDGVADVEPRQVAGAVIAQVGGRVTRTRNPNA